MPQIYLDNASTSFPKPPTVAAAVYQYMTEMGSNINRGSYDGAYAVEDAVFNARRLLCDFFGAEDAKNVVFYLLSCLENGNIFIALTMSQSKDMKIVAEISSSLLNNSSLHIQLSY